MNAKVKAIGIMATLFLAFSAIYCEIVILTVQEKKGVLLGLREIKGDVVVSKNETQVTELLA